MSDFIKVKKGDEVIEISPLTLAGHQKLGWVLVEEKDEKKAEAKAPEKHEDEEPAKKAGGKK